MFPTSALPTYHRRSFVAPFARLRGALVLVFALFAVLLAFPLSAARAELMYGVRADRMLVSFDSATPGTLTEIAPITGIEGSINALALRPANGRMYVYAVYQGLIRQLYSINMTTGAATAIGDSTATSGNRVTNHIGAIAFNPLDGAFRIVKKIVNARGMVAIHETANLTYNPDTGAAITYYGGLRYVGGDPNYGQTILNFSHLAYAVSPAGSVTLYGFESNRLVTIGNVGGSPANANSTRVFTVASGGVSGFTISPSTGVAYVSVTVSGVTSLYTLNLTTGEKNLVGSFGASLIGIAVAPPPVAPVSKWMPVDVATNRTDNTSRLLWKETTNRYAVWKLTATGAIQVGKYYSPVSGYTCEQIAVAPNGQATLLWKNPTVKRAQLWTLAADLSSIIKQTTISYPSGWTAQNLAADPDNNLRLSWRRSDSAVGIWTINPATGVTAAISGAYGPYANLLDGPLAVGADGRIRLLWRNTATGGAVVWTIPASYGAPSAGYTYNPVAGATATDIAVSADNKARLQWVYTAGVKAGRIALWKLNTTVGGNGAIETGKFYGPIADVSPLGLSVGGDNQTRLLWKYATTDKTGRAALWVLDDPLTTITKAYTYGPIY